MGREPGGAKEAREIVRARRRIRRLACGAQMLVTGSLGRGREREREIERAKTSW